MAKKKDEKQIYICCQCNKKTDNANEFYKTVSGIYAGTGRLPICKDCFAKLFKSYSEKYEDPKKAIQRICMAFDLYYRDSIYEKHKDDGEAMLGKYIRSLNMGQYNDKTFDTTLDAGFDFQKGRYVALKRAEKKKKLANQSQPINNVGDVGLEDEPEGLEEPEEPPIEEINPKDIEKWGDGFEQKDYDALNAHYKMLKDANPNTDNNQEVFIRELCFTNLIKSKAFLSHETDDYIKLSESYRKSFQQAGLKTSKEQNTKEDITFGVTIETIEKIAPADYYRNKSLFRDFDNIGEYIERFMLRPLRNLMHGTNDRDHEFYVKDEGDENGYTDED